MTAPGYREFSRLWQEQVDPQEQATLHRLAKGVERTALRRRAIDAALALAAIGAVVSALLIHSVPTPAKLALAAVIGLIAWTIWKRQRILESAQALAACEPDAFFTAAIGHARAELNYSTFSLWLSAPITLSVFALLLVPEGLGDVDLLVSELFGAHVRKTMALIVTLILIYSFYIRANFRLREQVRRLEGMRREWEREDAGGRAEES